MSQIDDLKAAGFSDDEIGGWATQQRSTLSGAGFSDDEINNYFGGGPTVPKQPPKPWLDRLDQGGIVGKALAGATRGMAKGWEAGGGSAPAISPEDEKALQDSGLFGKPGQATPLQFLNEAIARPLAAGVQVLNAIPGAALGGIAGAVAGAAGSAGQTPTQQEELERDIFQLGQAGMIEGGMRGSTVTKPHVDAAGNVTTAHIGELPTSEDFVNARKVTADSPSPVARSRTEAKLMQLYSDQGLHPAEVAEDASNDVTVTQSLASAGTDLPERYVPRDTLTMDEPAPGKPSTPEPPAIPSDIPNGVSSFRPEDLRVDAARFQFKEGGDESGVTERLRGVEQWDPIKAGMILAWEDNAGQKYVVDGHQRVALADRIAKADPAQDPMLNGILLREADGVSDIEARTAAASKNIAEGTGTAVDAAKVLRDMPSLVNELPPRSELVRQARGLANLGDEPFGMVVNDVVPPNYAAIVGRLVPDDPKMQGALLELLAKTDPANAAQAESIIRQGIDAGTRTETQASLFGDQQVVSSLFLDRAKVLDRTLKTLTRDRSVFSAIVNEQDVISSLGNKLESGANAQRAATDGQALQILQTLANRRGPLSDALTAAANGARDSGNYANAARDFAAAVRAQIESGDLTRAANGLERGRADAAGENAPNVVDPNAATVRPADEQAASEHAADLIGQVAPRLNLKRKEGKEEYYDVRGGDGRNVGIEIKVTINGGVANVVDIYGPGSGYLGPRAMRSLLRQFEEAHPEVTEIEGMRVSGARINEGAGRNLTTVRINRVPEVEPGQTATSRVEQLLAATERTEQGEQLVIPGAERSAQQAMEAREAEGHGRIAPQAPQQTPGGMFAPPEAEQPGLQFGPETGAIAWGPRPKPPVGSLEEAQDSILDKLSVGQPGQKRGWTWGRLYTDRIDKIYPISQAVGQAANGHGILTPDNPYQLSRLLSGLGGKIAGFLDGYDRRGNLVAGTRDWFTGKVNGESLRQVLEPVADKLDAFRAFAAAARGLELEGRGIVTGLDRAAMEHVARERVAEFGPVLDRLVDYQNRVAAYARDAGLISRDGYDAMVQANQLYVPFQRVMGDGDGVFRSAAGSLQPGSPLHRILGSERDVIDPIESIIRNTATMVTMAEKNRAVGKLRDMLTAAGQIGRPARSPITAIPLPADPALDAALQQFLTQHGVQQPQGLLGLLHAAASQPADVGTIRVFDSGVPHAFQIDPELARAVKGLDADTMGFIEKIMAPMASLLRGGAVLNPDFMIRHTFRDYLYGVVTARGFFSPLDMARGFMGLISKDERYWNWLDGGGGNISMVSMDRRYLQENIDRLTQQTGLMTRAFNIVADPNSSWLERSGAIAGLPFRAASKYVLHPLQLGVELAENASHLGAFIKESERLEALGVTGKEQQLRAAFASRDLAVDAARIGAKMKAYNAITAFANITLQDTDRVVRAFANDPVSTGLKVGAAIVIPSALLWYANHDDPRYQELPEWQKDMFWIFPTDKWEDAGPAGQFGPPNPGTPYRVQNGRLQVNNGAIFRLPKPWGMGVLFGSGTERSLEAFAKDNPEAFQHWLHSIQSTVVPDLLPTAVTPIIDQWTNRNNFTNRTLIPGTMEKQMPEYQYTPYTTETAKAIGRIVGAFPGEHGFLRNLGMEQDNPVPNGVARALTSPILIENYVRGWSGNLGNYTLQLADAALRKAGVLPDPPKPTSTLADIPVVRAFVIRYPSATTQSIQDFEDSYNKNKMFYDTWLAKAKDGDEIATNRIMKAGGPGIFVQLNEIQKTLNEHNQLIRDIYKDPSSSASDKRQLIDTIYYRMIEVGQAGKAGLGQINQALAGNRTSP